MSLFFMIIVKRLTAVVFFLSIFLSCAAQNQTLHGKVTDKSGMPIAYASITFKGFSYGTKTDKNGNYIAIISEKYDSIVCTHVSYNRVSEKIEGNTIINLIMESKVLPSTIILIDTTFNGTRTSSFVAVEGDKNSGDKYFEKVEILASFPGGEKALQNFLKSRLVQLMPSTFPHVKGVVKCGFNISKDGIPQNFILLKGIDTIVDEYVMQVLKDMPKWIPALQNGPTVEQYREVAIYFDIH